MGSLPGGMEPSWGMGGCKKGERGVRGGIAREDEYNGNADRVGGVCGREKVLGEGGKGRGQADAPSLASGRAGGGSMVARISKKCRRGMTAIGSLISFLITCMLISFSMVNLIVFLICFIS